MVEAVVVVVAVVTVIVSATEAVCSVVAVVVVVVAVPRPSVRNTLTSKCAFLFSDSSHLCFYLSIWSEV